MLFSLILCFVFVDAVFFSLILCFVFVDAVFVGAVDFYMCCYAPKIIDCGVYSFCSVCFSVCATKPLTLSPPNKLLSAKFFVCFSFQSTSVSLKIGESAV